MLLLYTSVDHYLKPGGRLGFVITQSVFETKRAGDGFRRFEFERPAELRAIQDALSEMQARPE